MLEETARITRIDGQHAWVETRAQVSCERCASGRGCGAGTLAQAFGNASQPEVRVRLSPGPEQTPEKHHNNEPPSPIDLKAGDAVMVGIDERAIVSGSLVLYGLPLLAMVASAIIAGLFHPSDGLTTLAGVAGLLSGVAASRNIAKKLGQQRRFEPEILRRLTPGSWEKGCDTQPTTGQPATGQPATGKIIGQVMKSERENDDLHA